MISYNHKFYFSKYRRCTTLRHPRRNSPSLPPSPKDTPAELRSTRTICSPHEQLHGSWPSPWPGRRTAMASTSPWRGSSSASRRCMCGSQVDHGRCVLEELTCGCGSARTGEARGATAAGACVRVVAVSGYLRCGCRTTHGSARPLQIGRAHV